MTPSSREATTDRTVFEVSGPDHEAFLQGIVTNDVARVSDGLVYAALLTPQGKYLADFFLVPSTSSILIDAAACCADQIEAKLKLYRLRRKVEVNRMNMEVRRGIGAVPEGAFQDPRHPALGWRTYGEPGTLSETINWDDIRVRHCIPETCIELVPDRTYILEAGFERLNGIDFRKGCYVGQEVTARMRHKAAMRKGLTTVRVEGSAPTGTEITSKGRPVGQLFTQSAGRGIAFLRFNRAADGPLHANGASVTLDHRAEQAAE